MCDVRESMATLKEDYIFKTVFHSDEDVQMDMAAEIHFIWVKSSDRAI